MSKVIFAAVSLALVLGTAACGRRGSARPPGGDGGPGDGERRDALLLRYALAPAELVQTGRFDMSSSGGGAFGEATLTFTAKLELAPRGEQLHVAWSFTGVTELDMQGMFADPAAAPGDAEATLVRDGKGALLVDARGQLDEDASKALAENAARRLRLAQTEQPASPGGAKQPRVQQLRGGAQLLAFVDAMIALPDLPEQALELGKAVVVDEEEQTEIGGSGMALPTATQSTYTLMKIDDSGGKRIAELQIDTVSRGAAETEGGVLSVDITGEGTVLFDLDAAIPVSYRLTRSQTITLGETAFESTMMLDTSFAQR